MPFELYRTSYHEVITLYAKTRKIQIDEKSRRQEKCKDGKRIIYRPANWF